MNIGVFFGSRSTEHDISVITAQVAISGLKGLGYKVIPVYIDKSGNWLIDEKFGDLKTFIDGEQDFPSYGKYFLDFENSHGKMVFKKKGFQGRTLEIDLAFPAFHGSYGEDGTIQGLFEMLSVPYVGCDVPSSAVAMDKALTKEICKARDIPTTKFVVFTKYDWNQDKKTILEKLSKLKEPLFVKPVHLGSSIGISKTDMKGLEDKIEVGLHYDDKVLVEEGVSNLMDVTCCIIGNDELTASEIQESIFSADLFDFEQKYLKDGGSQTGKNENGLVIPARIDAKLTSAIKDMAKKVYKAVGCTGIARVDFLLDTKTGEFYANEINPLPGTLYEHLWRASGIALPELLEKLIKFAKEKYESKKELTHAFDSSVLTSLKGAKGSKLGSKTQKD